MKLCLLLEPTIDKKWHLAKQSGVQYGVTKLTPALTKRIPPYDFNSLKYFKTKFDEFGIKLIGLEGDQFDMSRIKYGSSGRDEDIENFQKMIQNMGKLGLNLLCYNFMAGQGWLRTSNNSPARGGAYCTRFDYERMNNHLDPSLIGISEELLWENLTYFLNAVLPTAHEYGVNLALHPDDPPIPSIGPVSRIIRSVAAYERCFSISSLPEHGCTFCQATFSLMEDCNDIAEIAQQFVSQNRVHFIHMRAVGGTMFNFEELFHDQGSISFSEMLEIYYKAGFQGPIRPDHAPAMWNEKPFRKNKDTLSSGYGILGRIFAVGYLKGISSALRIPLE